MAASLGILREAGHSSLNETLKQHNGVTFKLVKTGESETLSTSGIGTELCVVITLLGQLIKAITVKPGSKRILDSENNEVSLIKSFIIFIVFLRTFASFFES